MSQTYETFGKYILLEKIQTGGMAEIYLARRPGASGVSKFLAIKRILPQFCEQHEFIEMFKAEAKIAVTLSHANLVSIHEFGMEKNQLFLAMDYVEGRNLRQILNKMKKSGVAFSIEQVLYVIREVAAGLDHAHRCIDANTGKPLNIIHRDMSPQNVMVSFGGEVKIVDFGIAKAETQLDNTRAGTLKGKFGYMSPEQAEGQQVDLRTDIFALGIVLWELLANDRLFVANNEINTIRKVRDCQIPSLRKIKHDIPQELERIVAKSLAKDRNLRYQTANQFHRDLNKFLNRQYPEFSPHDFSVFVKTLFSAEIIETRKKMVEYAKVEISLPPPPPPMPASASSHSEYNEKSGFTASSTMTENTAPPEELAKQAGHARQTDRGAAKTGPAPTGKLIPKQTPMTARPKDARESDGQPASVSAMPQFASKSMPDTSTLSVDRSVLRDRDSLTGGTYYGRSHTGIRYKSSRFSLSSIAPLLLIVIGLGAGTMAFYPGNPRAIVLKVAGELGLLNKLPISSFGEDPTPKPAIETSVPTPTYSVEVKSVPAGAEILLDGVQVRDITPATLRVPRNTAPKITVRLQGYLPVEQTLHVDRNLMLDIRLLKEKMGKLDIIVRGAGEIWVNDKKVADGSPVLNYPVRADQDIVVRAYDPHTNARDESKVRVGENALKKVTLFPRALRPSQDAPQNQ